ncbi:MAG: hypothetical protein FWC09_03120 [Lachnospiraceae bacterium]|nr:hypothetical protein [Lachnospiraceae bacterium]
MKTICDWIDDKKIAIVAIIIMIASLFPFFYLAHYARPGGDELGYAALTRAAWMDTGSIWEVIKASLYTVERSYKSISGAWFTFFFISLMPETFVPYSFWIGVYFFITINVFGTAIFFYYFLGKVFKFNWEYIIILYSIFMVIALQYLPSFNIGMYWYAGATHYIIPHVSFMLLLVFTHRFTVTKAWRYIVYVSLLSFIIGGISYHYCLLLFFIYMIVIVVNFLNKDKSMLWLILPFLICLIGFMFVISSPGHNNRANEEFGFNLNFVITTIMRSVTQEITIVFDYFRTVPLLFIALLPTLAFGYLGLLKAIKSEKLNFRFRYPLLYIVVIFLINSAMNTPRIYAIELLGVTDSSLGPQVTEWLIFLITWTSVILYCEGWIINKLIMRGEQTGKSIKALLNEHYYRYAVIFPILICCLVLSYTFRSSIKESFAYRAYVYVESGAAAEYKWRFAEYMDILLDDSIEEAYLKPINNEQGPLLHWTITKDENNFVNQVYKHFYRKKKVVLVE